MKHSLVLATVLSLLFVAVGPVVLAAEGDTPPGYIKFVGENVVATANGEFKKWRIADAKVDAADPAASFVEIEIDVASLDTDNQKRDDHLRNPDFFEVTRWPTARVRVHDVKKRDGDGYDAKFDVTIRDVEKSVDGTFAIVSKEPPTVEGKLILDRMDFGVGQPHNPINPMSIKQEIPITFRAVLPTS